MRFSKIVLCPFLPKWTELEIKPKAETILKSTYNDERPFLSNLSQSFKQLSLGYIWFFLGH